MNQKQQDEFKSLKQRLSTIQLVIKKDLKAGQLPRIEDADLFTETSNDMDRLCQNEWRTAMDDYMERLAPFQTAMKDGDLQAIEDTFKKLLDCKESCHKKFRQK